MSYSVLISTYYKEDPRYLVLSLDSVFNQTLPPDEVVLVEDGKLSDELESIVISYEKQHRNLKVVRLERNQGLGRALQIGLKHCTHELVGRMDTDDICFPDRFERQVKFMTENPDIDISSGSLQEFEGDPSNLIAIKSMPLSHDELARYMKLRNPLNHPAVMFRKSAVLKAGGYQHFQLYEDYYLWVRMFANGAKFANIPECLIYFRVSSDMYKRRGGFKYAYDNIRFQKTLRDLGLISTIDAVKSSVLRSSVFILPNGMRKFIYRKFLHCN